MDEATKKAVSSVGAWAATGMLGALGLIGYLFSRKSEDPLKRRLDDLRRHQDERDHAQESATWALTRAGGLLLHAIIVPEGRESDRQSFLQAAFAYATMAHGSVSSSAKHALAFGDSERKMLSDLGVELPSWDADLDFIALRASDIPSEQRDKLIAVAAEIRAAVLEREGSPKDPERSIWRIGYGSESRLFSDLSEAERAEILQEHSDWTAASILRASWVKHPPPATAPTEPAPAP